MTIGIQGNNLANNIGLLGANAPTAQPVTTEITTQTQYNPAIKDSAWYGSDLVSPSTINWNDFNVGDIDWTNNLHGAYDKTTFAQKYADALPTTGMAAYANSSLPGAVKDPVKSGYVQVRTGPAETRWVKPPSGMTGAEYMGEGPMTLGSQFKGAAIRPQVAVPLTFKDPNLQRYFDGVDTSIQPGTLPARGSDANYTFGAINNPKAPKLNHDKANIEALNANVGTTEQIKAIAEKYGVGIEEVQGVYDRYNKARQAIIDPVGANWADIKASPFYQNFNDGVRHFINDKAPASKLELPTGLPTFIPQNESFGKYNLGKQVDFDALNALAANKDLNAEYFALHDKNSGYNRNPYRLTNVDDFGGNAEKLKAAEALRAAAYDKGGQFDYSKAFRKSLKGKAPEGYDWRPDGLSDRGYNEALDISQNFLGYATNGAKDYHDVGFTDKRASMAALEKEKVKSGFLGKLGPLASIAAMIPGPWQIPAMAISATNQAAAGNPLGALASAFSFLPGASGVGLNPIAAGAGKLTGGLSSLLGDTGGKIAAGALKGAVTGAIGGDAGKGALLGAISPAIASGASSAGFSPNASVAIGNGVTGVGNIAYNINKAKQQRKAALAKQTARG